MIKTAQILSFSPIFSVLYILFNSTLLGAFVLLVIGALYIFNDDDDSDDEMGQCFPNQSWDNPRTFSDRPAT